LTVNTLSKIEENEYWKKIMPQFDTPINTNDQSLDRVLATPLPVMLILESGTSPFKSTLDAIAKEYAGKAIIARVPLHDNPETARRFGGSGLVVWKGNKPELQIAAPTEQQIREAAAFAIGVGPAPKAEAPSSTNAREDHHPISVNERTFEQEVLHNNVPVLVDFWAAWCGPCRSVAPTLDKLAHEFAGQVRIVKVNVDENPQLAARYRAHSIPQLTVFKGGKVVDQLVGAHPEPNIRKVIERVLR